MTHRRIGIVLAAVVIIVAIALVRRETDYRSQAPPTTVFLIVVDTLRPDRLSCYGYKKHETPHIDHLARSGVLFANAHAPASWTIPSMGSILTSRYPTQLGLVEVNPEPGEMLEWRVLRQQKTYGIPAHSRTLAEMLEEAGFTSAAFVNQPALNVTNRFTRGFDDWFYPDSTGVTHHDPTTPIPIKPDWKRATAHALEADSTLVRAFARWLGDTVPTAKRFVWLHLLTPHAPYLPPARYQPAEQDASALYDGEVRAVDELVGMTINAIDASVGIRNSLIVFVSDHGEGFGEHGMREHGHTLHQEVTRVPLIIASPSLRGRTVVESHARPLDIVPTILDLIGVAALPSDELEGRSLVPQVRGEKDKRPVYSEGMLYGNTERSLLVDRFKIMFNAKDGRYALFDVDTDPEELTDLSRQQRDLSHRMRVALEEMHTRLLNDFDRRNDPEAAASETDDEDLMKALRSLGYIK